jgi:site-specific DNA-methyltransferase (adenine-specific)
MISLHHASCIDWLANYDGPLFDACVTDPPYHLTSIVKRFGGKNAAEAKVGATGAYARASKGFMGKEWDGGDIAFRPETWRAVYDALKPGAHLVAFSGTRTYHRMACAIEDAGFEIRDMLCWHYGSGFPKSHDVSKGIDKAAGAEREAVGINEDWVKRKPNGSKSHTSVGFSEETDYNIYAPATPKAEQWQGWGTALKPATEPICLARKPLSEKSVAANVLKHGTGAINIDGSRVEGPPSGLKPYTRNQEQRESQVAVYRDVTFTDHPQGRWPANLCHDSSDEVLAGFPDSGGGNWRGTDTKGATLFGQARAGYKGDGPDGDSGSAARFFYSAKAGPLDRIGTAHATVKPVDLMRWLCRLVTPPGGHILEPFAGSGTTGIAAMAEGFDCSMIELEADHVADIERKLAYLRGEGALTFQEHNHAKSLRTKETPLGGLFGETA